MPKFVINDETQSHVLFPSNKGRGLDLRNRPRGAYGYGDVAPPMGWVIPRNEWQARAKELEDKQARISDLYKFYGLKPKDQKQTNYCWAFATVRAVEMIRAKQGQTWIDLSPASIAAQIKNYRNLGGWGKEALDWIRAKGITPTRLWPDTTWNNKSLANAQSRAEALKYRVTEWFEPAGNTLDQVVSCLLMGIPVSVGYDWWGHQVLACDLVWLDNAPALRILNSWGNWGEEGWGILQGSRAVPNDCVAPRVALATEAMAGTKKADASKFQYTISG